MSDIVIVNPSTVSEAWEMTCPQCHRDDDIRIKAMIAVILTPHGTDPTDSDTEWDDASIALCSHCRFTGTVRDFLDAFASLPQRRPLGRRFLPRLPPAAALPFPSP